MVWMNVRKPVVLPNYILKMLSTSSATIISFLVYRDMLYMKINIFSVLPWHARLLLNAWLKLPAKKGLLLSATEQPVREMTKFVLNLVSKLWLLISKSSLLGEMTNGRWIPVNPKLSTVVPMALTFHLLRIPATAVTATYGTSAMRDLSWKTLPMNQIMNIFLSLEQLRKKHRRKGNMLL